MFYVARIGVTANRTAEVPIVSSQTDEMPFGDTADSAPHDRAARALLLAAARPSAGAEASQLCALAEQVRDWDSLLSDARTHRVLPLLFKRLPEMGPAVPQAVRQRLRANHHRRHTTGIEDSLDNHRLSLAIVVR